MNSVFHHSPLSAPHLLSNNRLSPSSHPGMPRYPFRLRAIMADPQPVLIDSFLAPNMSGRKRKASEEPDHDRMSTSPTASPSLQNRVLPNMHRNVKRTRTGTAGGRPLALPRLLETLSVDQMRQLLQNVCDEHPELQQDIVKQAPRPSIESTLSVLGRYEHDFREAFPLGNTTSDYAYNRVRGHLLQLIDALRDFTPHFLPPHETQTVCSLKYLDSVTDVIHRLPDWDTYQHQRHKSDAYDEIGKAWALVIREAAKRAGGFTLQFGGWDQELMEHNQKSQGRLEEAVNEMRASVGNVQGAQADGGVADERASIRQQLFSGTYGQQLGVGHGQW